MVLHLVFVVFKFFYTNTIMGGMKAIMWYLLIAKLEMGSEVIIIIIGSK